MLEADAAVCEQSCKTIIQKYFDDRLCSGFSEGSKQHIASCSSTGRAWR